MNVLEFILLVGLLLTIFGTRWLDRRVAARERTRALHPSRCDAWDWPIESDGIPRSREGEA